MGKVHGKDTVIKVGAVTVVGCNTSVLTRTGDVHDTTEYGAQSHGNQGGLKAFTFTCGGVYDNSATAGPGFLFAGHETETLEITRQLEGTGTTKPQNLFSAVLNSYAETDPVAGMVTWQADFTGDGDIDDTPQV